MVSDKDLDRWAADRRVAAILTAASAPADPVELARERQAVSMFLGVRDAKPAVVPDSGPSGRAVGTHAAGGRFRGRLRFVVITGAAVLAAGGVAVAAPAGGIPGFGHHHPSGPGTGSNTGVVTSAPPAGTHRPTTTGPTSAPPTSAPATGASSGGQTVDDLHGRCQSWASAVDSGRSVDFGKAPFDRLAAAAGGVGKVPAFCATLHVTPSTPETGHTGHDGTSPPTPPQPSAAPRPSGHPRQSSHPARETGHPVPGNK